MLLKFLEKIGRKRVLLDRNGNEYMHRYYLVFKEKQNAFENVKPWPNIFIHRLLRSDEDKDHHDHPWWYCTIILKGGYYEWTPFVGTDGKQYAEVCNWRGPGSIIWRRATALHRLEMYEPTTTLFIHGWRKREWGFLTKNGWIDRITYIKSKLVT